MSKKISIEFCVLNEFVDVRLDVALSQKYPEYSRSALNTYIREGCVTLNGRVEKKGAKHLKFMDEIVFSFDEPYQCELLPEALPLTVIAEGKDFLVIEKPIGLVVHPGVGNASGTLVNALLHHYPMLQYLPRAGLIHRLDKNTTGLLLVAKTPMAYQFFVQLMSKRLIKRKYRAILEGDLSLSSGTIDVAISRDKHNRLKRGVDLLNGKRAVSHYRLLKKMNGFSYIEAELETGRTHQLRVHFYLQWQCFE